MRIAVQMDPIDTMIVERDTSLALMAEAQARGHEVWWFTPDRLFFDTDRVRAAAERVRVREGKPHYEAIERGVRDAAAFDVILIRQDPPFDMGYVSNTYLLERVPAPTLVLNRPRGVRNIPEKLSTLAFPHLTPKTFVGRDLDAIVDFAGRYEAVVVKPSFLAGGEGVVKLTTADPEFRVHVRRFLESTGKEPVVVQEFLPRVTAGDKRVFVLAGQAIGAVRRMPQGGDFRANLHVGGQAVAAELDDKDHEIAAAVAPLLAQEDILFAGLDVIDGKLTEINVTSPTLVRELKRFNEIDLPALFWDRVEAITQA